MRVALLSSRGNGNARSGQIFVISGLCQDARFRLGPELLHGERRSEDLCVLYFGVPEFGALRGTAEGADESEPYFILRRGVENGEVVIAVRIEWEGVFTVLANDDEQAERVFTELIEPASPEEVTRQWSADASALEMYQQILTMA